MTIEYIRYELSSHTPDQFKDGYARAALALKSAPECLGYEITQCEEAATVFVVRIHWESTQAHLNGFRTGPYFADFYRDVAPFFKDIAEMRHYATTDLVWSR